MQHDLTCRQVFRHQVLLKIYYLFVTCKLNITNIFHSQNISSQSLRRKFKELKNLGGKVITFEIEWKN